MNHTCLCFPAEAGNARSVAEAYSSTLWHRGLLVSIFIRSFNHLNQQRCPQEHTHVNDSMQQKDRQADNAD